MSDINRIQGNFRGITVQNKNNNVLKMDQAGNFSLHTKSIENVSYQKIINISEKESIYTAKNSDLTLSSENGILHLKNGPLNGTPGYVFTNPEYAIDTDDFFTTVNNAPTSQPFTTTQDVNNLRNNSLLIESLGTNSICLYSNNGINQVSHGNLNLVSDANILCQASHKLNLTSQGYILLNSERLFTSIEEDINILSSTGEFRVGGDGINGIGLKVNSNAEKNFTSLGRFLDKADRSLHIDIQDSSYDNTSKNGILIDSKSLTNQNTFPDIKMRNYDKKNLASNNNILTQMSLGLGTDALDINNQVFVKKENKEGITHLIALNNFKFTSNDVNLVIAYTDTNIAADTIKTYVSETSVIINTNQTDTEVTNFNYQEGYINRDNQANLKTETNSDLQLGTNKNNIMTVKNTGNIGINNLNPESTLDLQNNYGKIKNIRSNKNVVYQSGQAIQMKNGNYILFYNALSNSLYNLEANIYTINNDLVSNFSIYENSHAYINFSVDNLKGIQDHFVVGYSVYDSNNNYITKTKIFNQNGVLQVSEYSQTDTQIVKSTYPIVKSFEIAMATGENYEGYILIYKKYIATDKDTLVLSILPNNSNSVVSSDELTNDINTNLINDTIADDAVSLIKKNIKFINLVYNDKNQRILISFSGEFQATKDAETKTYFFSYIIKGVMTFNNTLVKPVLLTASGEFYKHIHTDAENKELLGLDLKVNDKDNDKYIYSCYETDNANSNRKIKKLKQHILDYADTSYAINDSSPGNDLIVDNINGTIPASTAALAYQNALIPIINVITPSNYYIVNIINNKVNYYSSTSNTNTEISEFTNTNMPFILSLQDINNNYLSTLVFFNNEDTTNPYLNQSINFRELVSESNILNIKNTNNNIQIKNTGDITIQDIVSISKSNKSTQFEKLVIKTDEAALPTTGIVGELRIRANKLFIYIDSKWKEFTLTDV